MLVQIMTKNCATLTLITLMLFVTNGESVCVNAGTSEGFVTLLEGQRACAPLQSDETEGDKGKRFVTCIHGNVFTQLCPSGLRFDTATSNCNWPLAATCQLVGVNPTTPATTSKPANESSSSQASPRPSTTTPRPAATSLSSQTSPQPRTTPAPPVGPCNASNCKLPNCFCFGYSPTGVPLADTPMFIMLTFDDHVSTSWYNKYFRALAVDNDFHLLNPSGNRPKFAFYVNHDNTDYTKVNDLWKAGHEIGSHTVHHRLPQGDTDSDYLEMVAEIQGLKDEMLRQTGNKALVDSIKGFRSPYLRLAGNVQFDVLRDYGFLYDTSILNINILQGKVPYWPFTLDYIIGECISPPCPTKPYPGMWSVPLNGWIGDDGQGCSMADTCTVGSSSWLASEQQWYDYYRRNFEQYFLPVKVPMPIFIHGTLFDNFPKSHTALIRWLQDTLQARRDVWLVSPSQVIKWMKNPLTNEEMMAQKWE